ncbi:Elongation of fatty acids protein 2 [Cichlidogyrus casuarinus]|uniref:Flap endonuclease 1 n=1 Tax=Cichlidogyrus casuarinus TaxID=1844966 RepID=A0ABD2Q4Y8_9PLAT
MENGVKPVYVFEGKPPDMKAGELDKRRERREEAAAELAKAEAEEDKEAIDKFSRRLVKVTPQHNDDCKQLLKLMGIPYVDAPGEAEAQCAALAKSGKVYAVGTEDMDALTFGAPVLLRHLTFSEARKMPIKEFKLDEVLSGLDMDMQGFIDLCILLGCDYCDSIKGIGPKKAIEVLGKHKNLNSVIENIDPKKYQVPEDWPWERAKQLFLEPLVTDPETIQLKWTDPDEEAVIEFLCKKNGFNEDRIKSGLKKLTKAKNASSQVRIDSFFNVKPSEKKPATPASKNKRPSSTPAKGSTKKRPK